MTSLPYGLRDVKIASLGTDGATKGTLVDLPNARTFSFSEGEEFQELRGDDKVVASRGSGPTVEWELESGGISLEALVVINGGSLEVTGTAPAEVRTYSKRTTDSRPYFFVEGQAISDSGGDFHVVLHRVKSTDNVEGELSDGEFWLTSAGGTAFGSLDAGSEDLIYEFVENSTVTAIA
jgi:hypothetical protein